MAAAAQGVTVTPVATDEALINPGMGFMCYHMAGQNAHKDINRTTTERAKYLMKKSKLVKDGLITSKDILHDCNRKMSQ